MSKKSPNPSQDRQGEIRRLEGEIGRLWELYEQDQIDVAQLLREQGPFVRRRRELADQKRAEKYAEYLSHTEAQRAGKYAKFLGEAQDDILSLSNRGLAAYGIKKIKSIEKPAPKDKRRRNLRKTLYDDTFSLTCIDDYGYTLDDIISSPLKDLLSRLDDLDFADEKDLDSDDEWKSIYDEEALYHIHSYWMYKRWYKKHWDGVLEERDKTREFYKKKREGVSPRRKPESLSIILEPAGDDYHHKIPSASTGRPTNKPENDLVVRLYNWRIQKEISGENIFDNLERILDAFCGIKMGKDNFERIIESYSN